MPEQDIISGTQLRWCTHSPTTGYSDYDHFRHIGAVIKKSGEVVKNIEETDANIDIKEERGKMNEVHTPVLTIRKTTLLRIV